MCVGRPGGSADDLETRKFKSRRSHTNWDFSSHHAQQMEKDYFVGVYTKFDLRGRRKKGTAEFFSRKKKLRQALQKEGVEKSCVTPAGDKSDVQNKLDDNTGLVWSPGFYTYPLHSKDQNAVRVHTISTDAVKLALTFSDAFFPDLTTFSCLSPFPPLSCCCCCCFLHINRSGLNHTQ